MRIAVTNENNKVYQHFNQCKSFAIFQIEDEQIKSKTIINADPNELSSLTALVSRNNIDIIICGDICNGAKESLDRCGIEIVSGVVGNIDDVIRDYMKDSLVYNNKERILEYA